MTELKVGTKVKDRYTLKEFKGNGSFGEVWLAHDDILDCDVAIKIYISLDPSGVEEFKSEYLTTQDISHPNLLTPNYFDVWGQRPFLVMKYCGKGSSSALSGKIDEAALWQFIHDVATGLNYLHSLPEPIIHQDIKPDNVLVDDSNRYLITDFGISKKVRATMRKQSRRETGAGATAYMGPERFESYPSPVKASDIWSLGVSIYELATGELPFCGLGGGMQKNGAELPILDDKWSKDLNLLMQSCLAKETWDRPTAEEIVEIANAKINGTYVGTPNTSTTEVPEPVGNMGNKVEQPKAKKIWLYIIGLIIIGIVGIWGYLLFYNSESTISAPSTTAFTEAHTIDILQNDEPNDESAVIHNTDILQSTGSAEKRNGPTKQNKANHSITNGAKTQVVENLQNGHTKGSYSFGYAQYYGDLRNGKPHGKGRLTFTSPHSDNRLGYSAETGDYIEGYFTNGSLDPGATLYKKDGTQKKLY